MFEIDKFIKIRDYIKCKYSKIDYLYDDRALVINEIVGSEGGEHLYWYIDSNGKEVIPCEYTKAYRFSEGLAYVEKNNAKYFIDINNNIVLNISELFPTLRPGLFNENYFSEGLFCLMDSKTLKYGYIDRNGKVAISFKFSDADRFSEGLAAACYKGKNCYINKKGTPKIYEPKSYVFTFAKFSGGIVSVKDPQRHLLCFYMNKSGEVSYEGRDFPLKLKSYEKQKVADNIKNQLIIYCCDITFGNEIFTLKAPTKEELNKQKKS